MKEIEQFEEVCHVCGHVKIVHVDMSTNLGNPGFICDDCDHRRREFERDRIYVDNGDDHYGTY